MRLVSWIAPLVPLALLPLTACTGGERASSGACPAGEVCSPLTPDGLYFLGNELGDSPLMNDIAPSPIAVGGTGEITLYFHDPGPSTDLIELDLPYVADDDGGAGFAVVTTSGPVVTLRGVSTGANYLRITEPGTGELYDRYRLAGAGIDTIELVGTELEVVSPTRPRLAWATGAQTLGVALTGEVDIDGRTGPARLIDSSMELTLTGATRTSWDTLRLPDAAPGTYPLAVTAGDRPTLDLPVTIVAGADAIELIGTPVVPLGGAESVCFGAIAGGASVLGLAWRFDVDGAVTTHGADAVRRNCIEVEAGTRAAGATIPVTAQAGGRELAVTIEVSASSARLGERAPRRLTSTGAGERATLGAAPVQMR